MRLTKKQLEVVDELQAGAFIWKATDSYYLATISRNKDGKEVGYLSKRLHQKTFAAIEHLLTKGDNNRWTIG